MTEQNGVERSSATEELRRMLDERGVEWWPMHDVENGYHQDRDTEFVIDGKKYTAHEWGGTLNVYGLTPEQAIAATLGRGTCHKEWRKDGYGFCSECGANITSACDRYCWQCGRRIVEVTE